MSGASYDLDFERMLASKWAGYNWISFQDLEGEDQAVIIAAYRIEQRIQAVEHAEVMRKSHG